MKRIQYQASEQEEWVMVELQGELVTESGTIPNRVKIGELTLKGTNQASFTIGNHLLEGSFVKLPHPLVLLQSTSSSHFQSKAIILRKIVFKNRPTLLYPQDSILSSSTSSH